MYCVHANNPLHVTRCTRVRKIFGFNRVRHLLNSNKEYSLVCCVCVCARRARNERTCVCVYKNMHVKCGFRRLTHYGNLILSHLYFTLHLESFIFYSLGYTSIGGFCPDSAFSCGSFCPVGFCPDYVPSLYNMVLLHCVCLKTFAV